MREPIRVLALQPGGLSCSTAKSSYGSILSTLNQIGSACARSSVRPASSVPFPGEPRGGGEAEEIRSGAFGSIFNRGGLKAYEIASLLYIPASVVPVTADETEPVSRFSKISDMGVFTSASPGGGDAGRCPERIV